MTTSSNLTYGASDLERQKTPSKPEHNYRNPFRRDYARLIHSSAFRRLEGKTQLYPGHESDFFRNRLTHSLEVAQIAKSIALKINVENDFFRANPIDCDLVEFAGLAHDLGHPPFGHNGEKALDDCMREYGGFEGNAQTLRLLAVIEKKATSEPDGYEGIDDKGKDLRLGLNLTYRTLASVLKYDHEILLRRDQKDELKKGFYISEKELVEKIHKHVVPSLAGNLPLKTIECQIMDVADDIAYSTYDLEDGLKGGFFDPLMLLSNLAENDSLRARITEKVQKNEDLKTVTEEEVVNIAAAIFKYDGNESPVVAYANAKRLGENGYARTAFTSALVDEFISGVRVEVNENMPVLSKVFMDPEIKKKVETLKHINYEVMITSPRLSVVQYRGYEIVKTIFDALAADAGHHLLPPDCYEFYSRLQGTDARKRLLCDFVAGMTDRYAVEFFGRLKQGGQSIFKPF